MVTSSVTVSSASESSAKSRRRVSSPTAPRAARRLSKERRGCCIADRITYKDIFMRKIGPRQAPGFWRSRRPLNRTMAADAGGYSETPHGAKSSPSASRYRPPGLSFGSHALAQIGTTAVAPPVPGSKAGLSAEDKKAKSAECSKQADTKGLHGKPRKKFRTQC